MNTWTCTHQTHDNVTGTNIPQMLNDPQTCFDMCRNHKEPMSCPTGSEGFQHHASDPASPFPKLQVRPERFTRFLPSLLLFCSVYKEQRCIIRLKQRQNAPQSSTWEHHALSRDVRGLNNFCNGAAESQRHSVTQL